MLTPYLLNVLVGKAGKLTLQAKAIDRHGNDLLRLLHTASLEEKPVSVSLENGKVYIGVVAAAPSLAPQDTYLSITPFYSGYRDRETNELILTVDYLAVYEKKNLDAYDFRVVLPMANIRVASFFDQSIYPSFIVESDQPQPDQPTNT